MKVSWHSFTTTWKRLWLRTWHAKGRPHGFLFCSNGRRWCCSSPLPGFRLCPFSESVMELPVYHLKMTQTSSSSCATTTGLLRPLIRPLSFGGVPTWATFLLLDVISTASASAAKSMCLVVLLTKTSRSFRHPDGI